MRNRAKRKKEHKEIFQIFDEEHFDEMIGNKVFRILVFKYEKYKINL